jgi:hypothetical protein
LATADHRISGKDKARARDVKALSKYLHKCTDLDPREIAHAVLLATGTLNADEIQTLCRV